MKVEPADAIEATRPLIDVLARLGIPHYIGGSLASSMHGNPRSTMVADLVADFRKEHVDPFCKAVAGDYLVNPESVRDAVRSRGSFNAIHETRLVKVDIFVLKHYKYER